MITREKWEALRDVYFVTRNIARTARETGLNELTVAKYVKLGGGGFDAIKDIIAISESREIERFITAQSRMTNELLKACGKLKLKIQGTREKDGTISVSPGEFNRLQRMLAESHEALERYAEFGQEIMQDGAGVLPRQISHVVNQNEHRQCEQRWEKRFNDWVELERRFLSPEQLLLSPTQRAKILGVKAIRSMVSARQKMLSENVTETR